MIIMTIKYKLVREVRKPRTENRLKELNFNDYESKTQRGHDNGVQHFEKHS